MCQRTSQRQRSYQFAGIIALRTYLASIKAKNAGQSPYGGWRMLPEVRWGVIKKGKGAWTYRSGCETRATRCAAPATVAIAICAVMALWRGLVGLRGDVRQSKEEWFRTFLDLPNGIPSPTPSAMCLGHIPAGHRRSWPRRQNGRSHGMISLLTRYDRVTAIVPGLDRRSVTLMPWGARRRRYLLAVKENPFERPVRRVREARRALTGAP